MIQTPAAEDAEALERPAWHWLLVGAAFTLAVFLPLLPLSLWASARLFHLGADSGSGALLGALTVLLALAIAATSAGAVVGRFGLRATRATAPLSGALGGAMIVVLSLLGGRPVVFVVLVPAALLLLLTGAACAAIGARIGKRLRPRVSR